MIILSVFWLSCAYMAAVAESSSTDRKTYFIRIEATQTCGVNVGSGTITCDTETTAGCCLVNNFWECCPAGSVCDTTGGVGTHYCDPGTQCAFGSSKYCYRNDVCCSGGSASTTYECCRECADDKIGCKDSKSSDTMITAITWAFISFGICLIMCGACFGARTKMVERRYLEHPDGLDEHGDRATQVVYDDDKDSRSQSAPQYVPQYGDGRRSVFAFDVEPASPSSLAIPQKLLRKPDYIKTNNEPREGPRNNNNNNNNNKSRPGSAHSVQSRDSYSSGDGAGDGEDDSDGGGTLCSPVHPTAAKRPKKTRQRRSSNSSVGSAGSVGSADSHASRNNDRQQKKQKQKQKARVIHLTGSAPYPPPDPYADKHHYAHPQPHIPNHRSTSPPPRGHAVEVHLGARNTATLAYDNEDDEDYSAHMRYEAATAAAIAARNRDKQRHNLQHNADGTWEISDQGVDGDPRRGNGRHNHIHGDNNNNNRRY